MPKLEGIIILTNKEAMTDCLLLIERSDIFDIVVQDCVREMEYAYNGVTRASTSMAPLQCVCVCVGGGGRAHHPNILNFA